MFSPNDIISELKLIKEAINMIEIRGEQNANNLLFACQKCDALIKSVEQIIADARARKEQNTEAVEAGE